MARAVLPNFVVNTVSLTAPITNGTKTLSKPASCALKVICFGKGDEVKELRSENIRLKEALAELVVRYDVVKKT